MTCRQNGLFWFPFIFFVIAYIMRLKRSSKFGYNTSLITLFNVCGIHPI